jgi:Flp pilus assembly protein TadG
MHCISNFFRDESGAVTIEFTTLVVAFIMMLVFFTDASIIYLTRSEMWSVARDITRRMSTEEISTAAEARDYAAANMHLSGRNYVIDPDFGGDMNVRIAVTIGEAAIFGAWFKPILGDYLVASVTMRREPLN